METRRSELEKTRFLTGGLQRRTQAEKIAQSRIDHSWLQVREGGLCSKIFWGSEFVSQDFGNQARCLHHCLQIARVKH